MARKCFLTTIDNPYDPYTQFDDWFRYDMDKGYSSMCYLARVAIQSDLLTPSENDHEMEVAIDNIVAVDPFKMYKKVVKEITE